MLINRLSKEQGLSDVLNYAHLVEEGIVLNKDGAFLTCYQLTGIDGESATPEELDALTACFNRMALLLEDGWMLHVDCLRIPSMAYPATGDFPDTVSALIDEERRQLYSAEGNHFENLQVMTLVWKFPAALVKPVRHWFVEGVEKEDASQNLITLLAHFQQTIEKCVGVLRLFLHMVLLNNQDVLTYLNTCITGSLQPMALPPNGCFLDSALGRRPLVGGYVPRIGNQSIQVLSLMGYLNPQTVPGLLALLGSFPITYRWSNRFIALSPETAEREIKKYRKHWNNKIKGVIGLIKETLFGSGASKINRDALSMSEQSEEALKDNSNQSTRFGYWSSTLVFMHEDISQLKDIITQCDNFLRQMGFDCLLENVNALDAWMGTLPGHGGCNVRRFFINSLQAAHVLPLMSCWAGQRALHPSSLLPLNAPPVFYAATTGQTPFRFHLDVKDVGHQLVLGPTGSGKTTLLGLIIAQFLRYSQAQLFVFDKDYSHAGLTHALNGVHYDIGKTPLSFCPLKDLSTEPKRLRAAQWVETLVQLQHVALTPDMRQAISDALKHLSADRHEGHRHLTSFCAAVQHDSVRSVLRYYTMAGTVTFLDAAQDDLQDGYLHTFEMGWLLAQKPDVYLPVLLHIFAEIESRLESAHRPTLIILEEAWLYMTHPVFSQKLKEWLKTLRKKNARVIFASQSLADLIDASTHHLHEVTAVLLESCPTHIFLPNPAMAESIRLLYHTMGLSERQIDIIQKESNPKQHYYVVTPEGRRLIELGLKAPYDMALSFIGLSDKKRQQLIECKKAYKSAWISQWLIQQGHTQWATILTDKKEPSLCA